MKFRERLLGKQHEFKEMEQRQKMLESMRRMHAAHLALADLEKETQSPQDTAIASNPDIIDLRHRHPDYEPSRHLTIEDINPEDYLNREVLMPSYVKIIPVESPETQTDIG